MVNCSFEVIQSNKIIVNHSSKNLFENMWAHLKYDKKVKVPIVVFYLDSEYMQTKELKGKNK